MNDVESVFRKREQANLHPSSCESRFLQKKHHILCYLALKYRGSVSQDPSPFFRHIWTDHSKIAESQVIYPLMTVIHNKVHSGFNRSAYLDSLAFAFLPAYFRFFLSRSRTRTWRQFLLDISHLHDHDLYCGFARIAFFLHFITVVFQPAL